MGDAVHWATVNNASRLGLRTVRAGDVLTAFADFQTGVTVDAETTTGALTQRHFFAGLRGSFGTVTVGRHSPAYKMVGLRVDPFYDTSALSAAGCVPTEGLYAGASFGLSTLTNGWADGTAAYTSPSVWGFTVDAALYPDPDADHDYGLGLGYRGAGLDVGVHFHDVEGGSAWSQTAGIDRALRAHAFWSGGPSSVGASYERLTADLSDSQDFFYASGTVNGTPKLTLAGAIGHVREGAALHPVTGTRTTRESSTRLSHTHGFTRSTRTSTGTPDRAETTWAWGLRVTSPSRPRRRLRPTATAE